MKKLRPLLVVILVCIFTACEKTDDSSISTSDRDKFLGNWNAISNGSGGQRNFQMTIVSSASSPEGIIIKGFDGGSANSNLPANVSGNDLSIVTTVISGETISGTGEMDGDTLRFDFSVFDGQTTEPRTCRAWK